MKSNWCWTVMLSDLSEQWVECSCDWLCGGSGAFSWHYIIIYRKDGRLPNTKCSAQWYNRCQSSVFLNHSIYINRSLDCSISKGNEKLIPSKLCAKREEGRRRLRRQEKRRLFSKTSVSVYVEPSGWLMLLLASLSVSNCSVRVLQGFPV